MFHELFDSKNLVPEKSLEFEEIKREASRYCPIMPFLKFKIYKKNIEFYPDYFLIGISSKDDKQQLLAFYSQGDFRPIDSKGKTLLELDASGPFSGQNTNWLYIKLKVVYSPELSEIFNKTKPNLGKLLIFENNIPSQISNYEKVSQFLKQSDKQGYCVYLLRPKLNMTELYQISIPDLENSVNVEIDKVEKIGEFEGESWEDIPYMITTLRIKNLIPVNVWDKKIDEHQLIVLKQILQSDFILPNEFEKICLRFASFSFYRNFFLMEVVLFSEIFDQYKKTYALISYKKEIDFWDIRPLYGGSPVIHGINSIPEELILNDDTYLDYLRFFGWAVHGDDGAFLTPKLIRELELIDPPTLLPEIVFNEDRQKLFCEDFEESDFNELKVSKDVFNRSFFKIMIVFYGNSVFKAWFKVHNSGMVEMLKDDTLIEKFSFQIDKYTEDNSNLFILKKPPVEKEEMEIDGLNHYLDDPNRFVKLNLIKPNEIYENKKVSPNEVFESLLSNYSLLYSIVTGRLYISNLGSEIFKTKSANRKSRLQGEKLIFYKCDFLYEVVIKGVTDHILQIEFIKCRFFDGFTADDAKIDCSLNFVKCSFFINKNTKSKITSREDIVISMKKISLQGDLYFYDCIINGELNAPFSKIGGSFSIRGCHFSKNIILYQIKHIENYKRISLISLSKYDNEYGFLKNQSLNINKFLSERLDWNFTTNINNDLVNLNNSNIRGNLEITSAVSEDRFFSSVDDIIHKNNISKSSITIIDGGVCANGLNLSGDLILPGSFIHGHLSIHSSLIKNGVKTKINDYENLLRVHFYCFGYFDFHDSLIQKDFHLMASRVIGDLRFDFLKINGSMRFMNVEASSASLYGSYIKNYLWCFEIFIKEELDLSFSEIEGYLAHFPMYSKEWKVTSPSIIGGNLSLSGSNIKYIEIRGLNAKKLNCKASCFEYMFISFGVIKVENRNKIILNEFEEIIFNNLNVKGEMVISGILLTGEKFQIEQSIVGSNFFLGEKDVYLGLKNRYEVDHTIQKDQSISQQAIITKQSNLNLRGIIVGGDLLMGNMEIAGGINLGDAKVQLDINLSASLQKKACIACSFLNMEKLECKGDIDLTGLNIINRTLPAHLQKRFEKDCGTVQAKDINVRGDLIFFPKDYHQKLNGFNENNLKSPKKKIDDLEDRNKHHTFFALIDGINDKKYPSIELTNAKVSHLLFTEKNLPKESSLIRLARAEIGRLEIVDPCPKPIDLSNIKVNRWVFGSGESGIAKNYLNVLDRMDPFDRSVWIEVENSLRNEGLDKEANIIYRAMNEKDRKEKNLNPKNRKILNIATIASFLVFLIFLISSFNVPIVENVPPAYLKISSIVAASFIGLRSGFAMIPKIGQLSLNIFFRFLISLYVGFIIISLCFNATTELTLPIVKYGFITISILFLVLLITDKEGFFGVTLSYGTAPFLPMVLVLLLTFPTVFLFSNPENVRIAPDLFDALNEPRTSENIIKDKSDYLIYEYYNENKGKESFIPEINPSPPEDWTLVDAVALSFKYQIPIINSLTHGRWEASSKVTSLGVTAEQYAFYLSIYHWIAWPIFLIGMTAKVFRGKK